ncbi:MAG TPA: twin-arginine translocase subunit TatC [Tepidisphaeraceae bacterium]|jgi:sec-independent protein translocase protein TatC|nr:twin-arginine translocase subunit TatC [Tepidisphaeraceae bacterium]
MTTATAPPEQKKPKDPFNPDDFRMTIGEHLEELRKRLVLGLVGFAVVMITFMVPAVGYRVVAILCDPLVKGMKKHGLPPQLHVIGLTEGFMTYLQICIVAAFVFAGPWLIYQLWLFIAAGLYPHERKTITKYIPLSLALLVSGVLFVYFLVLPLTVDFFLSFNADMPLPGGLNSQITVPNAKLPLDIPILKGDPVDPTPGKLWYNELEDKLKIKLPPIDDKHPGEIRMLQFTTTNLLASTITLDDYIGFVFTFMLVFGVAFQLPLVQLALVRVGLVEIEFFKKQRKIVWFVMTIVAAVMAPGDVVTSMIALLVPMVLLYEFGIWLAQWGEKQRKLEEQKEDAAN